MTPVVFDLDGTLIDSLPNVVDAANALLSEYDATALDRDTAAAFVGWGEQVFIDKLIAYSGLQQIDRAAILDQFIFHYKAVGRETRLMPGVNAAVQGLQARGVPLGLCTNKPRAALEPVLAANGMDAWFGAVRAGDDLPQRKPDPALLQAVCRDLGAAHCIYVGDSMIDAETAQRAAMPFALYTEGIRTQQVADIPHTVHFSDFADLAAIYENLT